MKIVDNNRRNRLDLMTPSEKKIYEAMVEIETLTADERLTNAQKLLEEAKNLVSDYVDEQLKQD